MAETVHLSQVDASNIEDHARLGPDDHCFYLFEYTSGKSWSFSRTNGLISNLKKQPSRCSANELYYKNQAVEQSAAALRRALNANALASVTLVPVPGSKAADHVDYDPRMERVCRAIAPNLDVRALVVQSASTAASHLSGEGERVTVEALLDVYRIDETLAAPIPKTLWVMDDVLTAGTHFRAMQITLTHRFPGVPIYGVFLARRVFAT